MELVAATKAAGDGDACFVNILHWEIESTDYFQVLQILYYTRF
jgi:hypothetical protein